MDLDFFITRLTVQAESIAALVRDLSDTQMRWHPSPGSWSLLEVINHLGDEERDDFRLRLDLTLQRPHEVLPPIDPEGWVGQRSYRTRDPSASIERFLDERQYSIGWLHTLSAPDWTLPCNHPRLTQLRAGDLLLAWVAHDLLHLRQIIELNWQYHAAQAAPFGVAYAGSW